MGRRVELEYKYWLGTKMVSVPYEAYVPHPLADWIPNIRPELNDLVQLAERNLSEADKPITSTTTRMLLSRAEGLATSRVENIRTTMRSLSLMESLRGRSPRETAHKNKLTLGSVKMNTDAVALASQTDSDITADDINELHRTLFKGTEDQYGAGRIRSEQVWVGHSHQTPAGAHFVPPPHSEVPALLADLAGYISNSALWMPSVVKAAVVHTQFETIHPYTDGNGRIGRALSNHVLHRHGHLNTPVPLSAAISVQKQRYYDCLTEYQSYIGKASDEQRAASLAAMIGYLSDAVVVACGYAAAVHECVAAWEHRAAQAALRSRSSTSEVLNTIRQSPAATITYITEQTGLNTRTTQRAVRRLIDNGLLAEHYDPESSARVIEAPALLNIIDNRDMLLAEAWRLHRDGRGDIAKRLNELTSAGATNGTSANTKPANSTTGTSQEAARAATAARAPRCGHIGKRSGQPCTRRAGHDGQHAY